MDFSFWNQSFAEKFVQSVCLTLLHSLWQGLVVAVLVGLVLAFTRKSTPALRYNLLTALLLGFVLISGATFWLEMTANMPAVHPNAEVFVKSEGEKVVTYSEESYALYINVKDVWSRSVIQFCTAHASLIVALWLFIFALKSAHAASGLIYLRKIKTERITEPGEKWLRRLNELSGKLRISQTVRLLESALVKVPMVAGYLKPVILLPAGMLCSLSAAQVEAILLHELAHIKRRDYLVNLIQIFCENIFFFNPAMIWLSGLIREEREHCCDDLAISVLHDRDSFVHALVSFQEYNLKGQTVGLAFSRRRNHLLDRIKRIIYQNNKQLNAMEKFFVTLSLLAVTAFSVAMTKTETYWKPVKANQVRAVIPEPQPVLPVYKPDTLPKRKAQPDNKSVIHSANVYSENAGISNYHVTSGGKEYQIVKKRGKIISLDIDGKEIPAAQYASHEKEIDKIEKEIEIAHKKAEEERKKADEMRAKADVEREKAGKLREEAEQQRLSANQTRKDADKFREQAEEMRKQAEGMREEAEKMREMAEKFREEAGRAREQAEVTRQQAEKTRKEFEEKQSSLINDLSAAGLVKDKSELSYKLSQDELVVNGVKQPADLHQKLKARYLGNQPVEMVYDFKGRTGYTISGSIHSK